MLGKVVTVKVDRHLGSFHPKHKDIYYPINYGYIEGIMAPDGEEQDTYILGVDDTVEEFTGMKSEVTKRLDNESVLESNIQANDILELINEEYGISNYGSVKYSRNEMYWIGYIYRYFAFTYEMSSTQVYKIVKPKELRGLFLPYHTMDPAQAIEKNHKL